MFKEIKDSLERLEQQNAEHSKRISALELWRESVMAKITGVIATVSIAWILVKEFLSKR